MAVPPGCWWYWKKAFLSNSMVGGSQQSAVTGLRCEETLRLTVSEDCAEEEEGSCSVEVMKGFT